MKILKLDVQGYRSMKEVSWRPGNLNVMIGPNGSGKSNLMRLLGLLAISAKGQLGKHVQKSGGMEPLLWDGAADGIYTKLKTTPVVDGRPSDRDSLTYQLDLARIGKTSSYRVDYEMLGNYYRVESGQSDQPFKMLERRQLVAKVFDEHEHGLVAPEESVAEEESLLSLATGPFAQNHLIPPFQRFLAGWSIYHDVHVNQDAAIRQPTISRHEKQVDSDGQNLISVLHTLYASDRAFKKDVNLAMKAAFGDDFEEIVFPPAGDQRVQMKIRWRSLQREQTTADLSDGTLRFLMLLGVLASPTPAPLIAIDEPETGLHPAMLPIVAEFAVEAAKRTQVVFTTHSPQFLDAFGGARPQTTVVKWHDGHTVLETLDDKLLKKWIKEYSLGALFKSGELEQGLDALGDARKVAEGKADYGKGIL